MRQESCLLFQNEDKSGTLYRAFYVEESAYKDAFLKSEASLDLFVFFVQF